MKQRSAKEAASPQEEIHEVTTLSARSGPKKGASDDKAMSYLSSFAFSKLTFFDGRVRIGNEPSVTLLLVFEKSERVRLRPYRLMILTSEMLKELDRGTVIMTTPVPTIGEPDVEYTMSGQRLVDWEATAGLASPQVVHAYEEALRKVKEKHEKERAENKGKGEKDEEEEDKNPFDTKHFRKKKFNF